MQLNKIKGIGKVRQSTLEASGIFNSDDLINYFPYKYYDFTKTEPFADDGRVKLIKAYAIENPKIVTTKNKLTIVSCKMNDELGHTFSAVWYNQTYLKSVLYLGAEYYLYGKNSSKKKNTFIVQLARPQSNLTLGLLPIYHSISGVGQKVLHDAICSVLEVETPQSNIPQKIEKDYNLITLPESYNTIHNPNSIAKLNESLERVSIEKIILLLASNAYLRNFLKTKKLQNYSNFDEILVEFEHLLPFSLTFDQKNAIAEIQKDMVSSFTMNRLLQGDVGSGKTVVGFLGAYLCAKNNLQSAIIAPTEILAKQHYKTAKSIFNETVKIVFLSGQTRGFERKITLDEIKSGEAQIIIGTHSIFSDDVEFKNLAYIVVDEQHRFGVNQRAKLKQKGLTPDMLVMSATPIPRSLSLVLYGELELSIIKNKPKNSLVKTNLVSPAKQNDMWNYIKNKIAGGSKAYVICALIDEENEDDSVIKYSAKNTYAMLGEIFDKSDLGIIHGKLSKDEQSAVIEKFRANKIKILVSTTIVEVGVDVPEADIMVICTPEKFGLSTLHQLRGRIGRNGQEAYCFCLSGGLNQKSYDRLMFFKEHYNGFDIAEYDLKTRGAGSIYGTNQHGQDNGIMSLFSTDAYSVASKIYDELKTDPDVFEKLTTNGIKEREKLNLTNIVLN